MVIGAHHHHAAAVREGYIKAKIVASLPIRGRQCIRVAAGRRCVQQRSRATREEVGRSYLAKMPRCRHGKRASRGSHGQRIAKVIASQPVGARGESTPQRTALSEQGRRALAYHAAQPNNAMDAPHSSVRDVARVNEHDAWARQQAARPVASSYSQNRCIGGQRNGRSEGLVTLPRALWRVEEREGGR